MMTIQEAKEKYDRELSAIRVCLSEAIDERICKDLASLMKSGELNISPRAIIHCRLRDAMDIFEANEKKISTYLVKMYRERGWKVEESEKGSLLLFSIPTEDLPCM